MVFDHVAGPAEREGERYMKKMIQLHLAVQKQQDQREEAWKVAFLSTKGSLPESYELF